MNKIWIYYCHSQILKHCNIFKDLLAIFMLWFCCAFYWFSNIYEGVSRLTWTLMFQNMYICAWITKLSHSFSSILPLYYQFFFSHPGKLLIPAAWKVLSWLCSQFRTLCLSSSSVQYSCPRCTFIGANQWKSLEVSHCCQCHFGKSAVCGQAMSCSRLIFWQFSRSSLQWCTHWEGSYCNIVHHLLLHVKQNQHESFILNP